MITTKEMKEVEDTAEDMGVSRIELMENAGRAINDAVLEKLGDDIKDKKVLVICGQGNNGGDGFVAARFLNDEVKVDVLFLGEKDRLPNEASLNYEHLNNINKDIIVAYGSEHSSLIKYENYDIILDAMLGTGTKGPLEFPYNEIVKQINAAEKAFVISVDVPTGINPNTGESHDNLFIDADLIVTLHDTKPGLKQFEDKVKIVDIGIPF